LFAGSDYSGDPNSVTADVVLPSATQFTAYASSVSLHIYMWGSYEATYGIEVYQIDGNDTGTILNGGQAWGNPGDDSNLHEAVVTGFGQTITFRARCFGDSMELVGSGIVYFE